MRKKITVALLLSLIVFGGCEKKLDIQPTFLSSEENALSSVDGIDAGLSSGYSYIYGLLGTTFTLWSELMADHLYYNGTLTNYANYYNRDLNAVIAEQTSPTDTRNVNSVILRQCYDAANISSLIIRGVNSGFANKDIAFPANKSRLLGEAYFIRAVSYFEMLRYWSRAWNATPDNSQPGLVIDSVAVDDRVSQLKPRSSVADVYAFVIGDLKKAISLLPTAYDGTIYPAAYNGRTYKDGAMAYLAKVYFQQQNYVKAKELIDQIIGATAGNLTKHPLNADITAPFRTQGASNQDAENILQNTASDVTAANPFWSNSNTALYKVGTTASTLLSYASKAFMRDARFLNTDQRKINWFKTMPTGELLPQKYGLALLINVPLIRSAELVLDRAEINALASNTQDAINDCNVTRARAQIALLPNNIDPASLLDSIKTERIRELSFEGDRLWNLKRMQVAIPPGDRLATPPLPWDGVDLVLKYAPAEMSMNPLLVNNY